MALGLTGKDSDLEQNFNYLLNGLMKKILGKGSASTEIYFLANMILVKTSGILTTQEKFLLNKNEGGDLIKNYRCKALEAGQQYIISEIKNSLEMIHIEDIYYDINVQKDTAIMVLTLKGSLND
ncbi:MAG: DUF2294 family protein [Syntrophomonadaceae bacterium]|nr:DUF2294 family protein [Syntrophomonadaceae bacterium]